jgi:flagellar motor protein MotB
VSKGKLVAVSFVWLLILGIGVVAWRYLLAPVVDPDPEPSDSIYRHTVDFHLDSFSGYALLRSDEFRDELRKQGIRLTLTDDGADYSARIRALQDGVADMAVFTVDALVKVSAQNNEISARIIGIVDETTGADAIVAYKAVAPDMDALNRPDARFVLTPDSPSETLARVAMAKFKLDQLDSNPFIEARDAEDVFNRYKSEKRNAPYAYVLWEPYVSKILENSSTHTIVTSEGFPSYIVDVIVVNLDFLKKHDDDDLITNFLKSYFQVRSAHQDDARMVDAVVRDADETGTPLSREQAVRLVDGIWWKNTRENLVQMGVAQEKTPLMHIEDVISNITDLLVTTGAISADPTNGRPNYFYDKRFIEKLASFRPAGREEVVRDIRLAPLTDQQWSQLTVVGTVDDLEFPPGNVQLSGSSRIRLDELSDKLKTTRYYVMVRGNAAKRGDAKANLEIAKERAKAAEGYLIDKGINRNRIRAVGIEPTGKRSVAIELGQPR